MHFGKWLNSRPPKGNWINRFVIPSLAGLILVAITTALTAALVRAIELGNVGVIYLLPVFIVAARWGLVPALICAVVSVGASAFFFYPPIFSFKAQNWDNQVDLVLFTIVAIVTSHLASRLRRKDEIDRLREALIGSVSHELRTPLASILGASSVISEAPSVKGDARLSTLANVVREEADRLNHDIQNLLDATRISSEGIRPKLVWIDPADIVNTAIERRRRGLFAHKIEVKFSDSPPLFQGDPVLIDQAIGQVLSNAAKYSPAKTTIKVEVAPERDMIEIRVVDQGGGLTADEEKHWGERFYRGERHMQTTTGSGLGTWIAKAFVEASGGTIEAHSQGQGHGCTVIIKLPIPDQPPQEADNHADE